MTAVYLYLAFAAAVFTFVVAPAAVRLVRRRLRYWRVRRHLYREVREQERLVGPWAQSVALKRFDALNRKR